MLQKLFMRETILTSEVEDSNAPGDTVFAIEEKDVFYTAAQWCMLILAALLPIWFLPFTASPVLYSKAVFVSILAIGAVLFYLAHAILRGKIVIPFHYAWLAFFVALIVWAVSALASEQVMMSLRGTGGDITTVVSVLTFGIVAFMIFVLFGSVEDYARIIMALGIGFVIFLVFTFFFAFGGGKLFGGGFADQGFNTVGVWRSVGVVLGFYILFAYPFLLRAEGRTKIILTIFFIAGLVGLAIVNIPIVWGIVGFFSILYLSYAIWQRVVSGTLLGISLLLLLISLVGFFSSDAISSLTPVTAPLEVNVSPQTNLALLKSVFQDNILLGQGPGTFLYSWDRFKPLEINETTFWNTRFPVGSSLLFTVPAEVGILGGGAFIIFLVLVWLSSIRAATVSGSQWLFALSSFVGVSYMILIFALYPAGYTIVVLGFVAIGLSFVAIRLSGGAVLYEIFLFHEGPSGFVISLILVFLMILGAGGAYLSGTRYAGQIAYAKGLEELNRSGDINKAEAYIQNAIKFDSQNAAYARALSQLRTVRARNLANTSISSRESLGSQFTEVLDQAIRAGQNAIALAPLDYENYQSLGKIYEFLISLGANGAMDAAVARYSEGLMHAPKNPALYRDQALAYFNEAIRTNNVSLLDQAESALKKSTELKTNYTDAHFLLAQIYDAKGNQTEAIRRAEATVFLAPNDIGALFQLGLMYYKANRLQDAEAVFGRAVSINSNYSNARYFLGLIFDRTNRTSLAIVEFEAIAALNPNNAEVPVILENLRLGRPALTTIVPPPEKRASPPLSDN